ncbi:SpoIIE family protein phosphatase [Streptomyces sp. NPDC002640]
MEAGHADDSMVLNALLGDSPQGMFVFDAERRVVRYNPSGRGVRGLPAENVVGRGLDAFAPGFDQRELTALFDEVSTRGVAVRGRLIRGQAPSEPNVTLALEVSLFPLRHPDQARQATQAGQRAGQAARAGAPGLVAVVEDVTERHAASERLAVLGEVHKSVGSTLDEEATAHELVEALVPRFADAASVDLVDDGAPDRNRPVGPLSSDTPLRRAAFKPPSADARVRDPGDSAPFPFPTPHTQVLNDTHPRLVSVGVDEPWIATDPQGFAPLLEAGVHSMIVAPLIAREATLGLLTVYRNRPDAFGADDLEVARQAALTAAAHLDNARSYRCEHTIASTLQRRLQPGTVPRMSAAETAHVYLPESAGGDWFDVIPLSGARVGLVVGEVVGHGIEAAATMGQLRTALRALALQDLETEELLTHLDEVAAQLEHSAPDPGDAVATCAIAVYDPVSQLCTAVRAGHVSPVVLGPDGSVRTLDVPEGPALGAGGRRAYTPVTDRLPEGSLLALYTNGLVATHSDPALARRHLERVLAPTDRPLPQLCDAAVYHMAPTGEDDAVLLLARVGALSRDQVAEWTLPSESSVVATARRLVEQQLTAWGLEEISYATELIVSELVTNAIRYGKGPILLRLIHDDHRLLSEVTDRSSASPHLRQARESDEGGRGLFIVMKFSERWGVRHSRHDKTIWSEQKLGGEQPVADLFPGLADSV